MQYYIDYEGTHKGPFDLLGMIRKVRNGSLKKNQMILSDAYEAPVPAYQDQTLYEVFVEQDRHEQSLAEEGEYNSLSFGARLKSGTQFISDSQTGIVFAGLLCLLVGAIGAALVMLTPTIVAAIATPFLAIFMFQIFFICMLKLSRVQLLSLRYLGGILKKHSATLILCALPVSLLGFTLPWLLSKEVGLAAWGLAFLIGLPLMVYSLYIPLVATDRGLGFKKSWGLNHKVMCALGLEGFAIVAGFLLINIVLAPLIIAPLFTLPITFIALCELYDSYFNEY